MEPKEIYFTSMETKDTIMFVWKDDTMAAAAWPVSAPEDVAMVEAYGGQYEIERTTVDRNREIEKMADMWERFHTGYLKYIDSFSIDAIVSEDLDAADMMKIKMTMFKKDLVRECKDRELLAGLRKANDIVDVMMYYGMIRRAANRSV